MIDINKSFDIFYLISTWTDRKETINQFKNNVIFCITDIKSYWFIEWNNNKDFNQKTLDPFRVKRERS